MSSRPMVSTQVNTEAPANEAKAEARLSLARFFTSKTVGFGRNKNWRILFGQKQMEGFYVGFLCIRI